MERPAGSSIVVVDYGAGNLRSVVNALERLAVPATITHDAGLILAADGVIVPGVGAAADTMRNLIAHDLPDMLRAVIARGTPFLGICMGLQALLTVSDEGGEHPCLDVVPGRVRRLPAGLKVPHMGWNQVWQRRAHPAFDGIPDGAEFYFVHSYYADPDDDALVLAETRYGQAIPAVIARDNILATQFHPEKSGRWGLRLLENFAGIVAHATVAR
jgi:imidazole glycerol-phosphate synthase subunit HisH